MKVVCPHCNFSRNVDPSKIPENAKRATCPKCHQKFDLDLGELTANQAPPPIEEETTIIDTTAEAGEALTPKDAFKPAPATDLEDMAAGLVASGDAGPEADLGAEPAGQHVEGIPWEDRQAGFFGDLWATIKQVLFSPGVFFDRMPISGGFKGPLIFGVIAGSIGTILSMFWQLAGMLLGVGLGGGMGDFFPATMMVGIIVGFMVLSPIFIAVALFIGSIFMHLFLIIVRGAGGGYQATFRVLAYATTPNLFNIVPFLGGFVAAIWSLVLLFMGLKRAHDISMLRVFLAVIVIPFVLMFILGIGFAILGGVLSS
ncbi:MAG: YIP1 family protein [Thermodesulfobacteriota bacterium]|nr:YIP1 family protein [Thermodesulfobacteriota bacterium]